MPKVTAKVTTMMLRSILSSCIQVDADKKTGNSIAFATTNVSGAVPECRAEVYGNVYRGLLS